MLKDVKKDRGFVDMGQVSSGWRAILEFPSVYNFFQNVVLRKPLWPDLVADFLPQNRNYLTVLDIGCGPGSFLRGNWLPLQQASFVGIDPSPEYIRRARADFPDAEFIEGTVATVTLGEEKFDLVVLSGVLHHLGDAEAATVMKFVVKHLASDGVAISVDPVLFPGQNPVARWMALADRGQNVRTLNELEELWSRNAGCSSLVAEVKSGYLRVPYNHVVCVVQKSSQTQE